jgi:predicted nucleotidyltransferase
MEERHEKIMRDVLKKYPYTFYLFGSRARGDHKKYSDLDICFFEDIPWAVRSDIKEDFEESRLPYKVDLVDWNLCDDAFKNAIRETMVLIQGDKKLT